VNAGRIMTGAASVVEIGREIHDQVLQVAAGRQTAAERLGHREYCIPYKYQSGCVLTK
jgi:altronate dehydratase large subunit